MKIFIDFIESINEQYLSKWPFNDRTLRNKAYKNIKKEPQWIDLNDDELVKTKGTKQTISKMPLFDLYWLFKRSFIEWHILSFKQL